MNTVIHIFASDLLVHAGNSRAMYLPETELSLWQYTLVEGTRKMLVFNYCTLTCLWVHSADRWTCVDLIDRPFMRNTSLTLSFPKSD